LAKAARMRELKSNHQILCASKTLFVRCRQSFPKFGQVTLVLLIDDKLIRIRPPVRPDRHRFASVNQLRAAFSKALPAPEHFFRDASSRSPIPAFHRLNGIAIADRL